MPVTQRWVHSGLFFAAAVFILSLTLLAKGAGRGTITDYGMEGSRAPDFQLRDLAFRPVSASDYSKSTLVLFFADRNTDCTAQLNSLKHMMGIFAPNDDVHFLGVQYEIDGTLLGHPDNKRQGSLERTGDVALRVAVDTDGSMTRSYRVVQSPFVMVVRDGLIRKRLPLKTDSDSSACMKAIREEVVASLPLR